MNREIKFRAWNKKHKYMEMFDSHKSGIEYAYGCFQVNSGYDSYDEPTYDEDTTSEWEIMQYTGIIDKAGAEIYEGDILYWDGSVIGAVSFDCAEFIAGVGRRARNLCNAPHEEIQIIGSIYENPELLESK